MKKRIKILLFITLISCVITQAQIVNIPDTNFKNALLNHSPVIDTNNDGNIQFSEAEIASGINVINKNIIDLTGIENFINLDSISCSNNQFSSLDLSNNNKLSFIFCNNNDNLTYVNLKNGNTSHLFDTGIEPQFMNCPNLEVICVDDINFNSLNVISDIAGHPITFTQYCSLTPALNNQIIGNIKLDLNNNGCDNSDFPLSNLMVVAESSVDTLATLTQNNGNYLLHTNEGNYSTKIISTLPSYYRVDPSSQTTSFTGFDNTFTANFCVEPIQTANDVNISLIPPTEARPGFNATYQIVYKNVGTTQLSGNIVLEFDETKLNFLTASETLNTQTSNSLTFDYSNLKPFETKKIELEFNVFVPPIVNIDDILNFTATINPITGDFTPNDNIFELNQTVIGSFDPNDIAVLEGDQILLQDAGKYLHYRIRFQNTGTASAINVVVKNILDANLDWSTLQLESLSHDNRVVIINGNELEFIFENIDLPDSTTDEPNSHGFIVYKIKPKADIALGDIIPNKADIFFDFNLPIVTNIVSTEIVNNTLAIHENTLLNFSVYPVPTENILSIKSKTEINKVEIYNKLGQLIIKKEKENKINISNLAQGLYFVKVEDVDGNFGIKKIVKK